MRIAIKFAYDGRRLSGYARQPNLKTVEGELIHALIEHSFIKDIKNSNFRSASRTDKGVSALGNVVAFDVDFSKKKNLQELNKDLSDIFVYGIKKVKSDFYPRHAKLRSYRYYLKNNGLDFNEILSASAIFAGEHDFSNFARVEAFKNPVRVIDDIIVVKDDDYIILDFFAQTFLWHQIRRIVSALEKVGQGKLEKEQIMEALKNPNEKVDFGLALPEPLILKDIVYNFEFEYLNISNKYLNNFEKGIITTLK